MLRKQFYGNGEGNEIGLINSSFILILLFADVTRARLLSPTCNCNLLVHMHCECNKRTRVHV